MEGNLTGITQVRSFLADNGKDLTGTPFVLQCNKQDLPEGSPASDIASALGLEGMPAVATEAVNGEGVLQTLSVLVKIVMKELREKGPGTPPEEPDESVAEAATSPEPASEADETMDDYAGQVCEPPVDESEDFDDETPADCGISVRIAGSIVTVANVVKIPVVVRNADREQLVTVSLAITMET
jgi:hypothetical protein